MIQNKQLTSEVIATLRFPLILGVVLIHNASGNWNVLVYDTIQNLLSVQLVTPCVPLFFFFSGYLFFHKNQESFTTGDYGTKLKKRARSLLLPYIFWTVVVLMYFALAHKFLPQLINPTFNNVYQFTTEEWIRSFWDYPGGQPVCYQFWFLRDLMVGVVLTPIIYYVVKYGKWYVPAFLSLLYIYDCGLYPYQMMITFFTMGACFSVNQYDFVRISTKMIAIAIPTFCVLLIFSTLQIWGDNLRGTQTIMGMMSFVSLTAILIEKGCKSTKFLAGSSFFVYAFHGFPIQVFNKVYEKVLTPDNAGMLLLCYTINFITIILLSLVLYKVLKTVLPKFTAVITGGR